MNLSQLANPRILEQPTYTPGKPIEGVAEENGLALKEIIKLASNENPWGASPDSIKAGQTALEKSIYTQREVELPFEKSWPSISLFTRRNSFWETVPMKLSNYWVMYFLIREMK